jgi:hypothetical protein
VVGVYLMDAHGSNQRMLRGSDHGAYPACRSRTVLVGLPPPRLPPSSWAWSWGAQGQRLTTPARAHARAREGPTRLEGTSPLAIVIARGLVLGGPSPRRLHPRPRTRGPVSALGDVIVVGLVAGPRSEALRLSTPRRAHALAREAEHLPLGGAVTMGLVAGECALRARRPPGRGAI